MLRRVSRLGRRSHSPAEPAAGRLSVGRLSRKARFSRHTDAVESQLAVRRHTCNWTIERGAALIAEPQGVLFRKAACCR